MSELPKGWKLLQIDEVTEIVSGGTPKSTNPEYYTDEHANGIAWITPADLSGYKAHSISHGRRSITKKGYEACSAKLMPKGTVLFSSRAPVGYVVIAENEISTNQGFKSFVPCKCVDSKFLFFYLKSIKHLAESLATGTTFKELSGKVAKTLPFPLAPLAEQKRIVAKLDEVLAQVDTIKARLDRIPAILKRFRQSVLASATSGIVSKTWRELNSPILTCKDELVEKVFTEWCKSKEAEFSRKGKLPKNEKWKEKFPKPDFGEKPVPCWNAINLASVAEVIDPNPSHRMPKYVDDGLPFISSENIVSLSCINFVKGKKIQEEELEKQKARYEVRDGTFAFTRIGTIGKSVLLPQPHKYGVSHAMAIVNPFQSLIDSRFLILSMNCKSILSQAHEGVQSVGVPDLGIGKMKSFIIPLPSIEEQKEIVRLVDQYFAFADTIEAQVKKAQARVDNLTQSILAKAFRGELVAQDPNDEPADKLLERIAKARTEAEQLAKAAKKAVKSQR